MTTFVDLLQEHRVHFKTEGRGTRPGWIQFQCPHCGGGSDPTKLYCGYNIGGNYVSCWQCGYHKSIETLSLLTKLSVSALLKEFKPPSRSLRQRSDERGAKQRHLELPTGIVYSPVPAPHRRFIATRQLLAKQVSQLWQLGYISLSRRLPWRVFIPVHYHGQIVSWTTRTIGNKEPRYISAKPSQELMPLKSLLFGEDYCHDDTVLVTEGPFDAMRIGPGAVALFGLAYTLQQMGRIAKYRKRIIVFDNEPVAQAKAAVLCAELQKMGGKTINIQIDAKDPGSASDKEIKRLRKELE